MQAAGREGGEARQVATGDRPSSDVADGVARLSSGGGCKQGGERAAGRKGSGWVGWAVNEEQGCLSGFLVHFSPRPLN